jgi:hypothetical protein
MRSQAKRLRSHLTDEELHSIVQKTSEEERLNELLENVSLKDISLEERRKEAKKPLYLTRYE